MANFTKLFLSGSTDGRQIKVGATATAGTTIHTATSAAGADSVDEVWVWAGNSSTTPRVLSLQWGSTAYPEDYKSVTVPAFGGGDVLVAAGLPLRNGLVVTATAAAANVISISGYVNRISGQSS